MYFLICFIMALQCSYFHTVCSGNVKFEDFLEALRLKPCGLTRKVCTCALEEGQLLLLPVFALSFLNMLHEVLLSSI